ncbi:hypothetical protein SM124_04450 (plasmid) [Bacillus sp. 31A1R]|uniref:Na+/H+ antiporter n=1 Tax=Robertmurraya mangrovi TaxID=3098077 RepID=A0ABU5IV36_9BACI|nr:hypothetical protein [Bacillus sp. 31A1R]MDZ5470999.1 hypothetical protein [Bacillus sp. 31A1R]
MSRLLSILLIGLGGYYIIQNRFRVLNVVFGNPMIRRLFVRSIMSFPVVRNRMMKSVFPGQGQPNY